MSAADSVGIPRADNDRARAIMRDYNEPPHSRAVRRPLGIDFPGAFLAGRRGRGVYQFGRSRDDFNDNAARYSSAVFDGFVFVEAPGTRWGDVINGGGPRVRPKRRSRLWLGMEVARCNNI